uniref:Peptidase_M13 domain-containing protein n=1 Tax=Steinernema glaseri TaxID=37863 RepID=A0A1I7Y7A7_9BILA
MTRASLIVAFLMACSVTTALHNVYNVFNERISPCTDLFGHVCVDKKEIRYLHERASFGLVDDLVDILMKEHGGDPVLRTILEAVYKEYKKTNGAQDKCAIKDYDVSRAEMDSLTRDEYKFGRVFAEMLVSGRFDDQWNVPMYLWCYEHELHGKVCDAQTFGHTEERQVQRFSEVTNKFLKGLIDRFVELVGFDFGPDGYVLHSNVNSSSVIHHMKRETRWDSRRDDVEKLVFMKYNEDSDAYRFRAIFTQSETFAAYGNVLFAHTLYTNEDKLNPKVAVDFDRLAAMIKEEVLQNIKDSDWLTDSDKKSLADYMDSLTINVGAPRKYRNVTLLEEMLKRYRTAFANTSLDGECDLEMLTRTHGRIRHQLIYEGIGTVNTMLRKRSTEPTIFNNNAHQLEDTIVRFPFLESKFVLIVFLSQIVNPGFLHVLNEYKLSTGFKYGYTAMVIGHEIFHGFGLEMKGARKHLAGAASRPHYKQQQKCYADFYGHKKFCSPVGCPVGPHKANEGYCDVESARVVFHLLQKALGASRKKRSPEDADYLPLFRWRPPGVPEEEVLLFDNTEDELKQFFYGFQLFNCAPNPSWNTVRVQLNDVHPRNQIRVNAMAQQMPGFSEIFKCKAGDNNYRVPPEEMCALYVRHKAHPPSEVRAGTVSVALEMRSGNSNGNPKSSNLIMLLLLVISIVLC